jgi:hypothetical protein
MATVAWCTTRRLPGSTSAAWIHLSSLKSVGTNTYTYLSEPADSMMFSSGNDTTASGLICHPCSKTGGLGRSFVFPSFAPCFTQELMAAISDSDRRASLEKVP